MSNKTIIKSIKILGIGKFTSIFTMTIDGKNQTIIGENNCGKSTVLKCIDFFFNENKTHLNLSPKLLNMDKPFIEIEFKNDDGEVFVRKELEIKNGKVKVSKTTYSKEDFSPDIINFIENTFVYYYSSDKKLIESDEEYSFLTKQIESYIKENLIVEIEEFEKTISEKIDNYSNDKLQDLDDYFKIKGNISLNKVIKAKFDWNDSFLEKVGSSEKKLLALLVLINYVKNIKSSILLFDDIEANFDLYKIIKIKSELDKIENLNYFITTFNEKTVSIFNNEPNIIKNGSNQSEPKSLIFEDCNFLT